MGTDEDNEPIDIEFFKRRANGALDRVTHLACDAHEVAQRMAGLDDEYVWLKEARVAVAQGIADETISEFVDAILRGKLDGNREELSDCKDGAARLAADSERMQSFADLHNEAYRLLIKHGIVTDN